MSSLSTNAISVGWERMPAEGEKKKTFYKNQQYVLITTRWQHSSNYCDGELRNCFEAHLFEDQFFTLNIKLCKT